MLAVSHAGGLIVDELAVTRDGDGCGGDRELLTKLAGDSSHLATLLAAGTTELRLGKSLWKRQSGCGDRGGKVLEKGAAGEDAWGHGRGRPFDDRESDE